MKLLITGGTGFIGRTLCPYLRDQGHDVWLLPRNGFSLIKPTDNIEGVINLAGAPIAKRWTVSYKQIIQESRILTTEKLMNALATLQTPPKVLLSGSAIGFYECENSFSHQLCTQWEQAALKANALGTRVCLLRTGIVLGPFGGALAKMRLPFLLGLGGPVGNGQQWMSWIQIIDYVRAIEFCLKQENLVGPIEMTAPNPVINEDFAKIYANVLHRPAFLRMPGWVLKIMMGQMAEELLLKGQKVNPEKLLSQGFIFEYPELKSALTAVERGRHVGSK